MPDYTTHNVTLTFKDEPDHELAELLKERSDWADVNVVQFDNKWILDLTGEWPEDGLEQTLLGHASKFEDVTWGLYSEGEVYFSRIKDGILEWTNAIIKPDESRWKAVEKDEYWSD